MANYGSTVRVPVTIAAGQSVSPAVNVGDGPIVGVEITAVTSWATANLTFSGSTDGTNFFDIYDMAGVEFAITVGALSNGVSRMYSLPGTSAKTVTLPGVRFLKIRSGTGSVPVTQTGAQSFVVILSVR